MYMKLYQKIFGLAT